MHVLYAAVGDSSNRQGVRTRLTVFFLKNEAQRCGLFFVCPSMYRRLSTNRIGPMINESPTILTGAVVQV